MKKIRESDFDHVAEYVEAEYDRRKRDRSSLEREWKDVDRQIEMRPEKHYKLDDDGEIDKHKKWMPEVELPLQAEALETLTADVRSMLSPDAGPWFTPHAALTDEYLERVDFTSLIAGDENDVPSKMNQDNADKLVAALLNHYHSQYDFWGNIDLVNAESLSYGIGVARPRMIKKSVYMDTARGIVRKNQTIPVLIPQSIKNTYLDDREHIMMREGFMIGPMQIFERKIALEDLKKNKNTDPDKENGGWMPRAISKLDADKDGIVQLLEAEGDFLIPRKTTESIFSPNTIVTVAVGKNMKVVRMRFKKLPYPQTILFPYHRERIDTPYPTSPLRKGRPLQAAATMALIYLDMASSLNALPPVGYDRNDLWFAQNGGPVIKPGAQWGTIGDIDVHKFGDPSALFTIYMGYLKQYSDVVGIHPARLGAQTLSHTTAFAKNAELQRGAVRTVDYSRSTLKGALTQFLQMEYEMSLDSMRSTLMYSEAYSGFIEAERKHMPDQVVFDAHGAGAPVEENQKQLQRQNALRTALEMDQIAISQGRPPTLDIRSMIEETLRDGGWVDIDPFINSEVA